MQEIQIILGNAYSTFSHFAIDREVFEQWEKRLSTPVESHSLLLEVLPPSLGLERTLNILLLGTILSDRRSSDDALPTLYKTAKELSTAVLNGVNITDKDVVQQLDQDDLLALFNLYGTPEMVSTIQSGFSAYLGFLKRYGSLLNVLNRHHGHLFNTVGTIVQDLPSLNERLPINDMEIPFHSKAFGLIVPLLELLERDGNIQPDTVGIPSYIDLQSLQMLYSSGLFGPKNTAIAIIQGSKVHSELLACGLLSIDQLCQSLAEPSVNVHRSLQALHSKMLTSAALSLATIKIQVQQ